MLVSTLQSVAMGLVIVFLDVGSNGWDWIVDPFGWVLLLLGLHPLREVLPSHKPVVVSAWVCLAVSVLIFPPDSVDAIDPSLGWLFSLPTVAFCFLLCDSLADVEDSSVAARFRWLRAAFVVVALLPALIYLVGWSWLTLPTAGAAVLTNIVLVIWLWSAGAKDADKPQLTAPSAPRKVKNVAAPVPMTEQPKGGRRKKNKDAGFDAEAVKRRARRARGE
jgi:hypothetical protein